MKRFRNSIKIIFFVNSIIIAFIIVLTFVFLGIFSQFKECKKNIKTLKKASLDKQKAIIEDNVERTFNYINYKRNESKGKTKVELQKEILNRIEKIRFGEEGYIFVNKYNGDALIYDSKLVKGHKNIKNITDPNGVKIFQEERKAVKNPKGGFIYYSFKKMSKKTPEPKVSFVKGLADWEWIIGAGVYIKDVDKSIEIQRINLRKKLQSKITNIFIFFVIMSAIVLFLAFIISKRINKEIDVFVSFFKRSALKNEYINENNLYVKEFKTLAGYANKMVSKRKQEEEALREDEKKLRKAKETEDKFFSIIGHDLRSPFNSILGFSNLIRSNIEDFDKEEIKKIADSIYKTSNNTLHLINNLLDWSIDKANGIKRKPEKFCLKDVVNDEIGLLNDSAKEKNINIYNSISEQTYVFADINMTGTVIRNILSNAIKFTFKNGRVNILSENKGKYVEITVEDTGVGLNPEDINNLFKKDINLSTRGTNNERGTGLGLILCKTFVEKNGGNIWVESELGKGSKFKFTLPVN